MRNKIQNKYRWDALKLRLGEGKGVEAFPWVKIKIRGRAKKEIRSRTLFRWFNKTSLYGIGRLMERTRAYPSRNQWTYMNPLWRPLTQINLSILPSGLPPLPTVENIRQRQTRIRQTVLPYVHVSLWDFLVPSFVSQCSHVRPPPITSSI